MHRSVSEAVERQNDHVDCCVRHVGKFLDLTNCSNWLPRLYSPPGLLIKI